MGKSKKSKSKKSKSKEKSKGKKKKSKSKSKSNAKASKSKRTAASMSVPGSSVGGSLQMRVGGAPTKAEVRNIPKLLRSDDRYNDMCRQAFLAVGPEQTKDVTVTKAACLLIFKWERITTNAFDDASWSAFFEHYDYASVGYLPLTEFSEMLRDYLNQVHQYAHDPTAGCTTILVTYNKRVGTTDKSLIKALRARLPDFIAAGCKSVMLYTKQHGGVVSIQHWPSAEQYEQFNNDQKELGRSQDALDLLNEDSPFAERLLFEARKIVTGTSGDLVSLVDYTPKEGKSEKLFNFLDGIQQNAIAAGARSGSVYETESGGIVSIESWNELKDHVDFTRAVRETGRTAPLKDLGWSTSPVLLNYSCRRVAPN